MPDAIRSVLLLVLVAGWAGPLVAAEADDGATDQDPPSATKAEEPTRTAAEDLQQQIGEGPLLRIVDDQLHWGTEERSWVVDSLSGKGRVQLQTSLGLVKADPRLVRGEDPTPATTLPRLLELAQKAGLGADDPTADSGLAYDRSVLTGLRLRGANSLVLVEGLLHGEEVETDRQADIAAAEAAAEDLLTAIDRAELGPLVTSAIGEVIRNATKPQPANLDGDEVDPRFSRQLIRHGWLDRIAVDDAVAQPYIDAIARLEELQPARLYTGSAGRLAELADAFGPLGWLLSTPERVVMAVSPPKPEYHFMAQGALERNHALTVIELPPGSDPVADPSVLTAATAIALTARGEPLAWWSAADGFDADEEAWRQLIPAKGGSLNEHIVSNYMPPHVVLSDFDDDVHRIITTHGTLDPPDGSSADAERFLADAAAALPDAAYLDLIGQYLFKYVYDSPDPRRPLVVGNRQISGDIHQTATETIATATGGRCRGDCDDLSELYQNIVSRQGRTAHVISLPAHAAVAWAEDHDDGWHTFVMQTGPTMEFVDERLQESLAKAYLQFDAADTFDPNGLGLLLRFSGENTRSSWRLSYRIFSEPDYAQTMIDVQRDWHFQTYLEGIKKMERMIAEGDEDTANFRELAGLFSFTGQHAKAAEYKKMAIDRTEEADSRLYETSEWINHLLAADLREEARRAVADVLGRQLPALREGLGRERTMQFGLQLAGILISEKEFGPAHQVLEATADDLATELLTVLSDYIANRYNERQWLYARELRLVRRLVSFYANLAQSEVELRGTTPLLEDPDYREMLAWLERYNTALSMYEAEEPSAILGIYASIGSTYAALLGDQALLDMIDDVASPDAEAVALERHRVRVGGLAQLQLDLPWIRVSPSFFAARLGRFNDQDAPPDPALVERLVTHLDRAAVEASELGLDNAFYSRMVHQGRLIAAILLEDEDRLRNLLQEVSDQNDKRLRDAAASTLGSWAKFTDAEWFGRILQAWVDIVDYKPKYFLIAWQAQLNDASGRALQMAELAADRFADDPAFVNEYAFMRELLQQQSETDPAVPDPEASPATMP